MMFDQFKIKADENAMGQYYVVKKGLEDQSDWAGIEPVLIGNYLWLDNGYTPCAYAKLYHTDSSLYVRLVAFEKEIRAVCSEMNEPVYEDSCLEFFLQPDVKDCSYLNFEFNPKGVLLLGYGNSRNDRRLLDSSLLERFSINAKADVKIDTIEWSVDFKIPYDFIEQLFPGFKASGTVMKGNFYKCGDECVYPHYGCWSKILNETPDFHLPEYFGTLILE